MKKEFVLLRTSAIKPYENNPRINDSAVDAVIESINQCEYIDPIEIDENNVILSGHTRLKALQKLKIKSADCIRVTGLTEEQKRKYRLLTNKTGELADWDLEKLGAELDDLDFGDFDFGFDLPEENDGSDFFENRERNNNSKQEGNDEYNEFVDKFELKKTTDDCYTPDIIYDAVADWVYSEYGVNKNNFVRPFYPGGDYQKYKYPDNCVVVDNPPFSILSEILRFYHEKQIKFFLFAPELTLFSSSSSSHCCLCVGVSITYENGANVNTSFLTSLESGIRLRSAPGLYQAVNNANKQNLKDQRKELPKYNYSKYVITSSQCSDFSRLGIDFQVPVESSYHIRQLDVQKESKKAIFGSGYLISEKVKAEREKAEREKAERWELSEREMNIVRQLK
jgi:hypothetical protein